MAKVSPLSFVLTNLKCGRCGVKQKMCQQRIIGVGAGARREQRVRAKEPLAVVLITERDVCVAAPQTSLLSSASLSPMLESRSFSRKQPPKMVEYIFILCVYHLWVSKKANFETMHFLDHFELRDPTQGVLGFPRLA